AAIGWLPSIARTHAVATEPFTTRAILKVVIVDVSNTTDYGPNREVRRIYYRPGFSPPYVPARIIPVSVLSMRRLLVLVTLVFISMPWLAAQQKPAAPGTAPAAMLTVDSIMRGSKLVGNPPTAVRWSKDSSKVYFSWQRAAEDRSSVYAVNKDGSGMRQLTPEEGRNLDVPQTGRFDRARKRVLTAEGGDVVIYDTQTGARRFVTRTSINETSPRWARHDTAITFVRDGNLYLVSLEGSETSFAQLANIIVPEATPAQTSFTPAGGRGAGGTGGRGGGADTGRGGGAGGGATETDAQRFLREQERQLIDFIRRQQESSTTGRGGGAAGGRAGGAGGGALPPPPPIAALTLGPRQNMLDLQLSNDERYVYVGVNERAEGTARGQDTPNYVTSSSYPEMIPGRPNVGDAQGRRLLAIMDVKNNKTVWADASAFAGVERKAKPSDPDAPRQLNWSMPDVSDDGAQGVVAVR